MVGLADLMEAIMEEAGMRWIYHEEIEWFWISEKKMAELGRQGWSMCGVLRIGPFALYYFKRLTRG